ncbi:hypothetical protein E2562_035803 [Oryza meyeriana var. granulata]|uniref:Retrotransposon gag domain-containing protein n=1 Tax=Oryza meyeriana var. granulata TaxID=110450 RepID=A0A6G1ECD0_9ORYZ|nr:hypothetical protein E2562_035803 [Oryza meyeriana var. granulata]
MVEDDLHAMRQNKGESLRDYVTMVKHQQFNECCNTIPKITDASIIRVFKSGVRDRNMIQELATKKITTAMKLFEIVERYARVNEAI